MDGKHPRRTALWRLALGLGGAALITALLLPASAAADAQPLPPPALAGIPPLPGPIAAPASPAPQGLALLKATPDVGKVGSKFTLTGEGLAANKDVDIVWATAKGRYVLNPLPDTVEYYGRQLDPISVVLARARTDASGRFSVQLTVPEDYGEIHDIYAVAGGLQIAKGGFRTVRDVTISPKEGPIGTLITIHVTGLGFKLYENTAAVLYDNRYVGYISATTTRGSAIVQIRAAGPVGIRPIELSPASSATPYLDIEQSAVAFIGKFRTTFKVTGDNGPPAARLDWPEQVTPTLNSFTTLTAATAAGVSTRLSSRSGPILSKVGLEAAGLSPGTPVELEWVTAVGTRAVASGWSLATLPLGQATPAADGSLRTTFTVPDNLGGWHAVRLVQNGNTKAEVPYFVERSLVGIAPVKVKAGEVFQIHLKGVGWTELDNGFAVTYDNGYIGYACGFYSNGDINMNLVATGAPGTHLIDLYPMIYKSRTDIWLNHVPMLAFKRDAPGLALGYRLPAVRLAIEMVE